MIQALSGLFPIFGGNDSVVVNDTSWHCWYSCNWCCWYHAVWLDAEIQVKIIITLTGVVVANGTNNKKRGGYSKTGTDIELKFGRDYYTSECCHFDGYVGLHIPGSSKPKGRFVFEAVPGFNQHFGFMLGGSSGTEMWRNCDRSLSLEASTNVRYWIRNTQTRSFDLKNRPWSRYMLVRTDRSVTLAAPVTIPWY